MALRWTSDIKTPECGALSDERESSSCPRGLRRPFRLILKVSHSTQIFFLVVMFGSEVLFVPAAFPHLNSRQRFITVLLCIVPYTFIYGTVSSTASVITVENHHVNLRRYPYDHVLFHPGMVCRTCDLLKPARSK